MMRTRTLRRARSNAKIAGVCGGIANYLGVEAWVVRCVAATGLIFMTSLALLGYWALYFVMDAPRDGEAEPEGSAGRDDHRSPAPELGPEFSPRRSLRNVRADLMQAELRLRRMECHITSGHYELQKELREIDPGASA